MENKKLGLLIIILTVFISVLMINLVSQLNSQAQQIGCFEGNQCVRVESAIGLTHFGFGAIGFVFALGFYLIFFSKGEEAILDRLEQNKKYTLDSEKFGLILKGLDQYEKKVITAIKDQEGITQSTLRLRSSMSKSKLSYVLQDLEKKNLVIRQKKGKTFSIFLAEGY